MFAVSRAKSTQLPKQGGRLPVRYRWQHDKRINGSTTYWLVVTRSGLESMACDNQPSPRPTT